METPATLSPDLIRQRRNLLIVSLALIFSNLAGAEFNDKIAVMGTEINFKRGWALHVGAWVFWTYFLVRFLQFAHAVPDWGIRRSVHTRMREYMRRHAGADEVPKDSYGQPLESAVMGDSFLRWKMTASDYQTSRGAVDSRHATLGFWIGLWWFARACVSEAISAPRITDYVVPIVVALAAPMVTLAFWMTC